VLSAAEKLAAEVGNDVGERPKSRRAPAATGASVFDEANKVDTVSVLDRLNIAHQQENRGVMAVCPGCGEHDNLVCKGGGLKCFHDRCAQAGPGGNPGFRTNVDLVMLVEQLDKVAAAKRICEWFGIAVPAPKGTKKTATPEPPPEEPWEPNEANAPDAPPVQAEPTAKPKTLADIVDRWAEEGPLVRVSTGIEPLDELSRGGLPVPWRVIVVGAPSAGKTALGVIIADKMARAAEGAGLVVGILGVDEEPEDLAVRLLQIAGYSLAEAETRDPGVLAEMRRAVQNLRVRLYDDEFTIESAAADLAGWAKAEGRMAALFLDSLHAVRSAAGADAKNPRESVEANVRAMRAVSTRLRMLVVASAEANRASYRTDDAAETTNDMAAGAESRAVEFGAQTQLMLRTPKGFPNVIHVRVAKNRRADRGEFWLELDRARHSVAACPDPTANPETQHERESRKQEAGRGEVERDAKALAGIVFSAPGMSERDLRDAVREAGHKWGRERLGAAKLRLQKGANGSKLVDKSGTDSKETAWYMVPMGRDSDSD